MLSWIIIIGSTYYSLIVLIDYPFAIYVINVDIVTAGLLVGCLYHKEGA